VSRFTSRNDLSAPPSTRLSLGKRARPQQPAAAADDIGSTEDNEINDIIQEGASAVDFETQDVDPEQQQPQQQRRRQVCTPAPLLLLKSR